MPLTASPQTFLPAVLQPFARRAKRNTGTRVYNNLLVHKRSIRPGRGTQHIAKTSEFWWEDEQEFDAVTEILHPKKVYLVAVDDADRKQQIEAARAAVANVKMQTAFASPMVTTVAEAIWEGRSNPPHFFKLRIKDTIEQDPAGFWLEVLGQNWKVELDYGLGQGLQEHEAVLVVAPEQQMQALLTTLAFPLQIGADAAAYRLACLSLAGVELVDSAHIRQDLGRLIDNLQPQLQLLSAEQAATA